MRIGSLLLALLFALAACSSSGVGGGGQDGVGALDTVTGDGAWLGLDCQGNDDCGEGYCNPFSGKCVECTVAFHCGEGRKCLDGLCVDDSQECTAGTVACVEGPATVVCQGDGLGWSQPQTCDDGVACTNDSCEPVTGCLHKTAAAKCDDANACTDDSCDPSAGCQNVWNLEGCGQLPVVDLAPKALDFGMSLPGNQEERALLVQNLGLGTLKVNSLQVLDAPEGVFGVVWEGQVLAAKNFATPLEIASGADQTFVVAFLPPSVGVFTGRLKVSTNDPNVAGGNLFVDLRGRGAEELCLNVWPNPMALAAVPLGQVGSAMVTLDNCGQGSVPIYDIYLEDGGCSDLAISSHEGYLGDLESGTFLVVGLAHEPDELGPCKATLVIENGSADNRIEVPISAEGIEALPEE